MWGTGLFPSLCALLFDYFIFPGPHCLLPETSAEYICYCGLQGSLCGPSSSDQFFHLSLFVAFPLPVRRKAVWSQTLCAILAHFASSPLDPICSSNLNVICRCSDLSSSLLPRLPGLLSTYLPSYTDSSISFLCLFPQNNLWWLFAHSAPLITVLLLCCLR